MRTAVELKNLSKSYGNESIVHRLNIKIKPGEIFALLGLNGAGKTTTIKMMLGLTPATEGEVRYFNQPFVANKSKLLPQIGSVIEHPGFYEQLTVFQNLKLIANVVGVYGPGYIEEVLSSVGLLHLKDDKVRDLMLSDQQKLAIARALLNNPSILVLDEPFNGLDIQSINEMRTLLIRLAKERNTMVFISSHVLSEIEKMADRIAILHQGKILKLIDRNFLVTHQMMRTVISTPQGHLLYERLKKAGYKGAIKQNNCVVLNEKLSLSKMNTSVDLRGIEIIEMYPKALTLQEYFIELIGGETL